MSLLPAVVALGDDALVLGQRLAEWCSRAPTLEEDMAMANTALDFLSRARLYYGYANGLGGRDEDAYAFERDPREFTNLLLFELPGADFAAAYARQFLVDAFDELHSAALAQSADAALADIGAKAHKEAIYHRRHSAAWVVRLGDGTEESRWRTSGATGRNYLSTRRRSNPWWSRASCRTAPSCGRLGKRPSPPPLRKPPSPCRRAAGRWMAAGKASTRST